jgi:hypothetical protein
MSESDGLIVDASLGEFFRDEIAEARKRLGVRMIDSVEFYLVNLLCDYIHSGVRPLPGQEPLAFHYKRALEATEVGDQIQHLRDLGDVALYSAGFFEESIESSLVDVDYYVSMGGSAYQNLAGIIGNQRNGEVFAEMYQSMGADFPSLVGVLKHLEEGQLARSGSHHNLLKLYTRWLKTGQPRLYQLLLEQGFVNAFKPPKEKIQ